MWGIVPGKKDINVSRIKKMRPGDWVFFSCDKRIYFGGTIALMRRNKALATYYAWHRKHAVVTALRELRRAGCYQRGIAARLARRHGGSEHSRRRAVAEARTFHEHKNSQDHDVKQETDAAQTAL